MNDDFAVDQHQKFVPGVLRSVAQYVENRST